MRPYFFPIFARRASHVFVLTAMVYVGRIAPSSYTFAGRDRSVGANVCLYISHGQIDGKATDIAKCLKDSRVLSPSSAVTLPPSPVKRALEVVVCRHVGHATMLKPQPCQNCRLMLFEIVCDPSLRRVTITQTPKYGLHSPNQCNGRWAQTTMHAQGSTAYMFVAFHVSQRASSLFFFFFFRTGHTIRTCSPVCHVISL